MRLGLGIMAMVTTPDGAGGRYRRGLVRLCAHGTARLYSTVVMVLPALVLQQHPPFPPRSCALRSPQSCARRPLRLCNSCTVSCGQTSMVADTQET